MYFDVRKVMCMVAPIDLTGMRFGMQEVLSPAEKPLTATCPGRYWHCRCDCGREYIQAAKKIKDNKSCGCQTKREDLSGQAFGRLIVMAYLYDDKWLCECSCGNLSFVTSRDLKSGNTNSCGCYLKEVSSNINRTHGISIKHPIYRSWSHIKSRCYNVNVPEHRYYGARGIKMCDEWC